MLSKKYFLGGGRKFSAPPARPTHAEVRDHIDPQESDHRASYMSYRGLQQDFSDCSIRLFRQHRSDSDLPSISAALQVHSRCTPETGLGGPTHRTARIAVFYT
jgi:hypothetical protein